MMKIKILNNAGYHGMDGVSFPVVVTGQKQNAYYVPASELVNIGCDIHHFSAAEKYCFIKGLHAVEVADE